MSVGTVVLVIMMILIRGQGGSGRNGSSHNKDASAPLPPPQIISLACEYYILL